MPLMRAPSSVKSNANHRIYLLPSRESPIAVGGRGRYLAVLIMNSEHPTVVKRILLKDSVQGPGSVLRVECEDECLLNIRVPLPSRSGMVVIFKKASAQSPPPRANVTSVTEIKVHNKEPNIEILGGASTDHEFVFKTTDAKPWQVAAMLIKGPGLVISLSSNPSSSVCGNVLKEERDFWRKGKDVRTMGLSNRLNDRIGVICGALNPIDGTLCVKIGGRELCLPLANLIRPGEAHVFTITFKSECGEMLTETIEADRGSFQRAGIDGNIRIEELIENEVVYEDPDSRVYCQMLCGYFRLCMKVQVCNR